MCYDNKKKRESLVKRLGFVEVKSRSEFSLREAEYVVTLLWCSGRHIKILV